MYPHNRMLAVLATALLLGCNSAEKRAQELDAKLAQEMARVEASLTNAEKANLPAEMAEMPKAYREALQKARTAPSPELKLYRLRDAVVGAELLETFVKHRDAAGKDLAPLEKLWNERRAAFAPKGELPEGPLLQRALAEAAGNRAQKLYQASLPYGKVSSPFAGVYYLAEAEGNRRFAELVASLPSDDEATLPRADRVEASLVELEQETVKTFGAEPTAPKMIPVSAKLKEARELLERKYVSGAALSLLEARARFTRATDDTLPASLASLAAERAPAPAKKKVLPASVTVTLVRWPYT